MRNGGAIQVCECFHLLSAHFFYSITFRRKYLSTLANVEDHKNEIQKIKIENCNIQRHINAGVNTVHTHLTEEFELLQALPTVLQTKLDEFENVKGTLMVAEQTVAALSHDLEGCITQNQLLKEELLQEKSVSTSVTTKLQMVNQRCILCPNLKCK
jgi:chromosome segregation ATPase